MIRPISSPWCLRFDDSSFEIRQIVERSRRATVTAPSDEIDENCHLIWIETGGDEFRMPAHVRATPLGSNFAVVSFRIEPYAGRGGRYSIECGDSRSRATVLPADPEPGGVWRFLIASDHQNHPNARLSIWAASRLAVGRPFQAILFPGDLTRYPDAPGSWFGDPDGNSFCDSMAGLVSRTPILACPGNHEVSSSAGSTPAERFASVQPGQWNIDVFSQLFLPWPESPVDRAPGWYAARLGPIDLTALFVARHWLPGDHAARTGPAYELPGRFIFEPITPGAPQHEWLREHMAALSRDTYNVVLMHHAPFAQGHNSLPLFGEPVEYRHHWISDFLVPLFERRANLVLSGHNHAVNHHRVNSVHYFESSHFAFPLEPARRLPDGRVAPEPLGHPSTGYLSEPGRTYFSVLEVGAGNARITTYRVLPARVYEEVCVRELEG